MTLDHPNRIRKFASIEIVPTHHVWTAFPRDWVLHFYHWMFMVQPYDFPERLLSSNLEYYMNKKLEKHMYGQGGLEPAAVAEYMRCCTPEQIHSVCEDSRAAATLDCAMDTEDFNAGNMIQCPVLVLWGDKSHELFDAFTPFGSNTWMHRCRSDHIFAGARVPLAFGQPKRRTGVAVA